VRARLSYHEAHVAFARHKLVVADLRALNLVWADELPVQHTQYSCVYLPVTSIRRWRDGADGGASECGPAFLEEGASFL
jgi:hypothetical protein